MLLFSKSKLRWLTVLVFGIYLLRIPSVGLSQTSRSIKEDRVEPTGVDNDAKTNKDFNVFHALYPIGQRPNIGYKSSMVPEKERILFEANPVLRMPLFNSFYEKLQLDQGTTDSSDAGSTLYLNFQPQFRMYNDNSKPVKMPSYKISILGYQKLIRLRPTNRQNNRFLALGIESGHYSNGQSKSAFSNDFDDGSPESEAIYRTITPETDLSAILNRESGNFSTNFTEIKAKYLSALGELDDDYRAKQLLTVELGYNLFHNNMLFLINLGGYTADDIKIYGKHRFNFAVSYMRKFSERERSNYFTLDRYEILGNFEYIHKPHASVNPGRLELTGSIFLKNNLGVFVSGIYGHDNYNYRFVDAGAQVFAGITFDIFSTTHLR